MPFSPTDILNTFAKSVCFTIYELLDIIASYFDNVTVYSKNPKYYLVHLRKVFEVVKIYNFTLRPDKCLFFQEEVELLGYTIGSSSIKSVNKILNKVTIFKVSKN